MDPSGHKACLWGDQDPDCTDYSDIDYQLEDQIEKPDAVCLRDFACEEAYLTYVALVWSLHFVPTIEYIIYMTAQAEGYAHKYAVYHGKGTFEGNFIEGLARNYWEPYEACRPNGTGTCSNSYLYKFLSGYQPWFDRRKSPEERAAYLLDKSQIQTDELELTINKIVNEDIAKSTGWYNGMSRERAWQWHNWWRSPNNDEAIGWIYLTTAYGDYFWIMNPSQTENFQVNIKPQGP